MTPLASMIRKSFWPGSPASTASSARYEGKKKGRLKRFSSLTWGDQLIVEPKAKSATPRVSRVNSLVCLPAKSSPDQ